MLSDRNEESQTALSIDGFRVKHFFDLQQLCLSAVNLVSRSQAGQLLQLLLNLLLDKGLSVISDRFALHQAFPGSRHLLSFAIALLNVSVILKISDEFVPRQELLVVDGGLVLRAVHVLIHFVLFDLTQHIVKGQHSALPDFDGICIYELYDAWVSSQVHHEVGPLQDFITVPVHLTENITADFQVTRQEQTLCFDSVLFYELGRFFCLDSFLR